MRLEKLRPEYMEEAVKLYQIAEDWTTFTHTGITPQDALVALTSPDSVWRLVVSDESKIIGLVGYERLRPFDGVGEPYIALTQTAQKKGMGLDAATMLFDWGRAELALRRIQTVVLDSAPSRPLLEKLGFKHEGTLRKLRFKGGKFIDGQQYGWVFPLDSPDS